ncbi:MAG: apolipoprotein N-acyltransferase [Phycisphaerales bacterium]|nr:apolipoprotein N-acyltransferase [Planctomycetota bacterium]
MNSPNISRKILPSFAAGVAHAILMGAAFAPLEFWPACIAALVPLVWAALCSATPLGWKSALAASLGASLFYWYQQQWVCEISAAGYVPLVLYLSIYPGLFVLLLSRLRLCFPGLPLSVLVPIVWTGLEWFRGEVVWDGYAWFLIAHPLIDAQALALAGSVVGAYGVGAFVASFVGIAFDLWQALPFGQTALGGNKQKLAAAAAIVLLYAGLTARGFYYGRDAIAEPLVRVGLVQTNIPQSNKIAWSADERRKSFARFLDLSRQAAARQPAFIIWPETMFPGNFLQPAAERSKDGTSNFRTLSYSGILQAEQRTMQVPMLIGALGTESLRIEADDLGGHLAWDKRFNSVFLLKSGEVHPLRYDKIRLTPFGETMPYISAWPWLQEKLLSLGAEGMSFDLAVGSTDRIGAFEFPVTTPSPASKRTQMVRVVTPICFEITESSLCRKLVNRAAQGRESVLIANLTNDGWFGSFDPARRQHQLAARWRSLELGVAVVRAANTGISSVTEFGRQDGNRLLVVNGQSCRVDGVLVEDVALYQGSTFFREVGDLCWLFPTALAALLIVAFRRQSPNKVQAAPGSIPPQGGLA